MHIYMYTYIHYISTHFFIIDAQNWRYQDKAYKVRLRLWILHTVYAKCSPEILSFILNQEISLTRPSTTLNIMYIFMFAKLIEEKYVLIVLIYISLIINEVEMYSQVFFAICISSLIVNVCSLPVFHCYFIFFLLFEKHIYRLWEIIISCIY